MLRTSIHFLSLSCHGAAGKEKMLNSQIRTMKPIGTRQHDSIRDFGGYEILDPLTDAAVMGAAFVCHLGDVRFASLRALRHLAQALEAERTVIGMLAPQGAGLYEELVWSTGSGRCGESERVQAMSACAAEVEAWLCSPSLSVMLPISMDVCADRPQGCECLLLIRGSAVAGAVPVFAAQLGGATTLPESAVTVISTMLDEYARRRPVAVPRAS